MSEERKLQFRGGIGMSLIPVAIYVFFCMVLFIGFKAFNMEALAVGGFLALLIGGVFCTSYSDFWESAIKGISSITSVTDNKGRVVNFKNTIIIMTSNLGSSLIRENFEKMTPATHDKVVDETKIQVLELLKKTIRPEFLNRIDDIIMFTPLNEEEIRKIVSLQLNSVKKMLATNGVALDFTNEAVDFIADKGFDPQFGARPVKRVIQKYVLNELSKALLGGTVDRNRPIVIDRKDDGLEFKN